MLLTIELISFIRQYSFTPKNKKTMCCSSNPAPGIGNTDWSLQTANTGIINIASPNPALDGSNSVTVITATGTNGTIVK
jgi:hypothetical protein